MQLFTFITSKTTEVNYKQAGRLNTGLGWGCGIKSVGTDGVVGYSMTHAGL